MIPIRTVVLRNRRVARIARVEEIPRQHLLLAALDKVLRRVRHAEKRELPVRIQIPVGARSGRRLVGSCAGECVLAQAEALYERAVLEGESGGDADAFVVPEDVGLRYVEVGEQGLEVGGYGFGGVVAGAGDRGGAAAAEVDG